MFKWLWSSKSKPIPESEEIKTPEKAIEIKEVPVAPYTPPMTVLRLSCGCRGCGEVIPAWTEFVMATKGPFHKECLEEQEREELDFLLDGKIVVIGDRAGVEYKSLHAHLKGTELLNVARAIRSSWKEYERLKSKVPSGVTLEKEGTKGMIIRISSMNSGVWLFPYMLGVQNEGAAYRLANAYEQAYKVIQELKKVVDKS